MKMSRRFIRSPSFLGLFALVALARGTHASPDAVLAVQQASAWTLTADTGNPRVTGSADVATTSGPGVRFDATGDTFFDCSCAHATRRFAIPTHVAAGAKLVFFYKATMHAPPSPFDGRLLVATSFTFTFFNRGSEVGRRSFAGLRPETSGCPIDEFVGNDQVLTIPLEPFLGEAIFDEIEVALHYYGCVMTASQTISDILLLEPFSPTTGTLESEPLCPTPGQMVRVFGTGWVTIRKACEYDFFFSNAQIASQGPPLRLTESPDKQFTVPAQTGVRKIRVDLIRTEDRAVVATKMITRFVKGGTPIEGISLMQGVPDCKGGDADKLLKEVQDDEGNKVQVWCVKGRGAAAYQGRFIRRNTPGFAVIGQCVYNDGINDVHVEHSGDHNGNKIPDCFVMVRWVNTDGGKDDDGDGRVDSDVYKYDVEKGQRTEVHFGGSSLPIMDYYFITTPEFHDPGVNDLHAQASPGMHGSRPGNLELCDLNRDGTCDEADRDFLVAHLGTCIGDPGYHDWADLVGDNCVDSKDVEFLNLLLLQPHVLASPDELSPADHRMVPVTVSASMPGDPNAVLLCKIISITSNEAENGRGDGHTKPDVTLVDDNTVLLRAERSGAGAKRIYTVQVECTDAVGNRFLASTLVSVPHDEGR